MSKVFDNIIMHMSHKPALSRVTRFTLALMYIDNPESRPAAISMLQLDDIGELKTGLVMSTKFKTKRKFGYQGIACSDVTYRCDC